MGKERNRLELIYQRALDKRLAGKERGRTVSLREREGREERRKGENVTDL